ncbi:hypothetical protein CLU81_2384 [Flavobacterium sp. 9]|uniref:Ig-like domain-containing protein n=1 Tax=Flavobacterium sp. 9 TaxID=2035198 RepID=UPI000C19B11C|nr:Ig-like domain-containing protein [Flavobacterium sp. 9]PIF31876.1 hypothetical protein CLU81_2384 [Flavobacterium sp. 9]
MKKTLLLFLLLPFFGIAQTDLAKWNAVNSNLYKPTVKPNVVAADISATVNSSDFKYVNNSNENVFYDSSGWPVPSANGGTYDPTKYISLQITAAANYKLDLSSLSFECRSQGNTNNFRIKYSKDPNFVTGVKDLMAETISTSTWTTYNPSFLPEINPVLPTQTVYIRIYVYNTNNNFQLKIGSIATNGGPTIKGNITNFDPNSLLAINDYVTTTKDQVSNISLIGNDVKGSSNINSLTLTTRPSASEGTITVNPDYSVTFNPALSYIGSTSFMYTITNATQSSTATVYLTVNDFQEENLALWNGASSSLNPVLNSNVTSGPITASGGVQLTPVNNSGSNIFFETSQWPTPAVNGENFVQSTPKYVTFKISPDQNHKIDLTTFSFTHRKISSDGQKFQVQYSKDASFATGVKTFVAETSSTNSWATITKTFASDASTLVPNETMYIRFYVYNTNNAFHIQNGNGNSIGPVIKGYVRGLDTLTAYNDAATTPSNQSIPIPVLNNDVKGTIPLQTMTATQPATGGSVVVNGLTDITFTPTSGFIGTSTFTYTLYNGSIYSSATVTVNVTAPPCVATPTPGINRWNGYVYTYTGTPAPTTYVGTVYENPNFERDVQYGTITGDQSVAADNFCGPVPAENFMVRYLMQTTTTADTYNFTIGGDDGVRLYIDGNIVTLSPTDSWSDHGYNTYVAQVALNAGTHNFILEYYEKGGIARVSFSHGAVIGTNASLPFGINKWNVYGFNLPDINLQTASFAGMYVDPNLNFDTQLFWNKTKSPSYYSGWQGAPMPIDNFTITYKRKGFPCGRYQLVLPNCDDVAKIFINGVDIFTQNGYSNANVQVNGNTTYFLNENSTVEVRLREDAGDANVALTFIDTPTEYNGTGTIPPNSTSIKITANTTLSNDIEVCSCTINPNVILTVPSNKTLTVNQNITVGTGGKLLLEDGASLLQTSTTTNAYQGAADSFQVLRNTDLVKRYDFTYWSAPITKIPAYTMHDLSPGTLLDKYQSYDSSANAWKINLNGTDEMKPGVGYAIRAPQNFSITNPVTYPATFTGVPNNGDYSVQLYATNYSLIGNPYPSAIDAQKFITINHNATPSVDVGSLYFWTHNTPPSDKPSAGGTYDYTSNDYAVLNLSGSTSTGAKRPDGTYEPAPSGKIASCQSFFMQASGPGVVKFTNDMRVSGSNNEFYKTTKTNELDKSRIWLNLTSNQGAFKQALVGYIEGATNDWDVNYDATTMAGNSFIDFYSINQADKLSIQGRALPFTDTDRIPLGYKTTVAGDFTIAIDHADGLFDNQAVYLEDKTTGKVIDLKAGNYTFTTAIGTFTDRFTIAYTKKTLGTGDFENTENDLSVSVKEKTIKVISTKENIKEAAIYDISGKLLYNKKKVDAAELLVQNLQSANQVLLVKITLDNDYVVTKKIIFN